MEKFVKQVSKLFVREVKGDEPGHPFRGNQFTGGEGGGTSFSGAKRPSDSERYPTGFRNRQEYEASDRFKSEKAKEIVDKVQDQLDERSYDLRKEGSQTYVSMQRNSPNLGERQFIDISNTDISIERRQVSDIQKYLDSVGSKVREVFSGARTYVSSEKSPNMGTRVFLDVDLKR